MVPNLNPAALSPAAAAATNPEGSGRSVEAVRPTRPVASDPSKADDRDGDGRQMLDTFERSDAGRDHDEADRTAPEEPPTDGPDVREGEPELSEDGLNLLA